MCGRYSLTTAPEALKRLFDFKGMPNLAPRYNIAPTQAAPVVSNDGGRRQLVQMHWGLVPQFAKDRAGAARMINARAETVSEKPSFREAYARRRCLVPADGFYEWRMEDDRKQGFRIGFKGGPAFAFAGIWERWAPPGSDDPPIDTFAIITTTANDKIRPIHPRMPVILPRAAHDAWLDPDGPPSDILGPHPADEMAFYRVGPRVNNARNDDADCIQPLNPPLAAAS